MRRWFKPLQVPQQCLHGCWYKQFAMRWQLWGTFQNRRSRLESTCWFLVKKTGQWNPDELNIGITGGAKSERKHIVGPTWQRQCCGEACMVFRDEAFKAKLKPQTPRMQRMQLRIADGTAIQLKSNRDLVKQNNPNPDVQVFTPVYVWFCS